MFHACSPLFIVSQINVVIRVVTVATIPQEHNFIMKKTKKQVDDKGEVTSGDSC